MKEVVITISPNGEKVKTEASGFQGSGCTDFMESILKALGKVEKLEHKPEYYETVSDSVSIGS